MIRTHIWISLVALFLTACASKENKDFSVNQQKEDEFTFLESRGSHIR